MAEELEDIAERIRLGFTAKDAVRERVLPLSREVIRQSSQGIRAIHRREFDKAKSLLKSASNLLDQIHLAVTECEEFSFAGFVYDAEKEYAEGCITLAVVTRKKIPSPDRLGVNEAAYINGMGEAVGELRRFLLDNMRQGDLDKGEDLLSVMDDIYSVLVTMDFPDAITGGLRRTTDNVRGILERTRSDLTLSMRQKKLEERIQLLSQMETKHKPKAKAKATKTER